MWIAWVILARIPVLSAFTLIDRLARLFGEMRYFRFVKKNSKVKPHGHIWPYCSLIVYEQRDLWSHGNLITYGDFF